MAITEKAFWYEGIKEGRRLERERIIALIRETYDDDSWEELGASSGSFVFSDDIIELIQENMESGTE
jgi:hypothetical protein